jgi:hypothetical protein
MTRVGLVNTGELMPCEFRSAAAVSLVQTMALVGVTSPMRKPIAKKTSSSEGLESARVVCPRASNPASNNPSGIDSATVRRETEFMIFP